MFKMSKAGVSFAAAGLIIAGAAGVGVTAANAAPSTAHLAASSTIPAPKAAVPEDSGTGRRIVYSLQQRRVWLVDADDAARRTFLVWPGTVDPDPGNYTISLRKDATTGSDGVEIQHGEGGIEVGDGGANRWSHTQKHIVVRTSHLLV